MKGASGSVELSSLDWEDRTFALESYTSSERLEASLDLQGFFHAPWIWERRENRYTIVDGFKRLGWARKKGLEKVECTVFPEESDSSKLMARRMEARLFGPPLNAAEKAQLVLKLASFIPKMELMSRFFPALGIPARPESLSGWLRLAGAGDGLLGASACEVICERAALELANWDSDSAQAMVALLEKLRCSASIQMEILERTTEIALVREEGRADLILGSEISGIIGDPGRNHRQKTQALRELLGRWRFPRLRAREVRFARDLADSSLPKALRLTPPAYFEGDQWQIQASFSSPEQLEKILEQARAFAKSSKLRTLMGG